MNDKNLTPVLISGVSCYEQDGTAYLRLEDVARGLGFTRIAASGNEVVMWSRVDGYMSDLGVHTCAHDGFIPENIFYRLAMKAKNETAEKFQALVADEIIPSIRKTGSYSIAPKMDSLQALDLIVNSLHAQRDAMNRLQVNVDAHSAAIEKLEDRTELMQQAFALDLNDWRKNAKSIVGSIVLKKTGGDMKDSQPIWEETWNEVYDRMDSKFHRKMKQRLENLRKRTGNKNLNMLDAIDRADNGDRARLISELNTVLTEMCIYYGVRLNMDKAKNLTNRHEDSQTSLFDRNCAPDGRLREGGQHQRKEVEA
jgi:prophage antirepressor-like protein